MTNPASAIEVVGFMDLAGEFRARGWASPHLVALAVPVGGAELLDLLEVPQAAVESLFVNHKAIGVDDAVIRPGDRVALVPPGVPGPHRFCLGIYQRHRD
ncbi:MoaD/ThiS family protein [Siculibacillus lacustris]|uniref:MoaD/ThiS family protein n=1 Tax=Siculibacillus lacustris TaxID=1549641 RepID=A0A4Q9VTK8_9HYPH|nr:MoaD/ThiS family protein [Siculibacillus lacustris]TBW38430.1 MoaD/ThiS family protein [Siculibacillus lacustris]